MFRPSLTAFAPLTDEQGNANVVDTTSGMLVAVGDSLMTIVAAANGAIMAQEVRGLGCVMCRRCPVDLGACVATGIGLVACAEAGGRRLLWRWCGRHLVGDTDACYGVRAAAAMRSAAVAAAPGLTPCVACSYVLGHSRGNLALMATLGVLVAILGVAYLVRTFSVLDFDDTHGSYGHSHDAMKDQAAARAARTSGIAGAVPWYVQSRGSPVQGSRKRD